MRWGDYLHKAQVEERVCVYFSFIGFAYVAMCFPAACSPTQYIFHMPVAWYSLYALKVPLNTKQTNKQSNKLCFTCVCPSVRPSVCMSVLTPVEYIYCCRWVQIIHSLTVSYLQLKSHSSHLKQMTNSFYGLWYQTSQHKKCLEFAPVSYHPTNYCHTNTTWACLPSAAIHYGQVARTLS